MPTDPFSASFPKGPASKIVIRLSQPRFSIWHRASPPVFLGSAKVFQRKTKTLEQVINGADRNIYCQSAGLTNIDAKAWLSEMLEEEFGPGFASPGLHYETWYFQPLLT